MGSCFYKKISIVVLLSILLQALNPAIIFADRVLWPSTMNLYNDTIDFDKIVPASYSAAETKKGFLFTGEAKEIFTLGAGHIGINVTLSGKGHVMVQFLEGLKKRGVKITVILINDKAPAGTDVASAPKDFRHPYCYMIDFSAVNGDWQKYNFNRIIEDYGKYADNWVIGNEINSQLYNFYGKSPINEYTKKYCESFKICYDAIKKVNEDANVYISFDQCWDVPALRPEARRGSKVQDYCYYRYNIKEQLSYINNYLNKDIDWGVSLHPYPSPVESGKFWDDGYAGFNETSPDENSRPYYLTLKNLEVAVDYLKENKFLKPKGEVRNVAITEFALTSKDGERIQAAGLYYFWKKISKNPYIKYFLYNAQTDVPDGFNFGLSASDKKKRKRLAWAVFKDMDREEENGWCEDLLNNVLDEYDYINYNDVLVSKASISELAKLVPEFANVDLS